MKAFKDTATFAFHILVVLSSNGFEWGASAFGMPTTATGRTSLSLSSVPNMRSDEPRNGEEDEVFKLESRGEMLGRSTAGVTAVALALLSAPSLATAAGDPPKVREL